MEIWKAIAGWEGFYEVSNMGRVRSLDRVILARDRCGRMGERCQRGVLLRPGILKNGYLAVSFTRPGKREYRYVHHLVARAFIGPCPIGQEVCHRDGVRANNTDGNLRYGTRSSNALDRHAHGTMNQAHGEAHYLHKLTAKDVRWIRRNAGGLSQREMGRQLGVTHGTIGKALNGETWRRVA